MSGTSAPDEEDGTDDCGDCGVATEGDAGAAADGDGAGAGDREQAAAIAVIVANPNQLNT